MTIYLISSQCVVYWKDTEVEARREFAQYSRFYYAEFGTEMGKAGEKPNIDYYEYIQVTSPTLLLWVLCCECCVVLCCVVLLWRRGDDRGACSRSFPITQLVGRDGVQDLNGRYKPEGLPKDFKATMLKYYDAVHNLGTAQHNTALTYSLTRTRSHSLSLTHSFCIYKDNWW